VEHEDRRQYLTEREVEQLCDAARKRGRYGHRDATMILLAYRHGLRVSELVALQWAQVDLETGRLQVIRRKGSDDSVQPLSGVEIRALRKVRREQPAGLRHVFVSERGAPFTANGFFKTLSRAAASIGLGDVHGGTTGAPQPPARQPGAPEASALFRCTTLLPVIA
jgi:type 1 fimbriae regulatory protein FimB/type 1 fimbriae regulatory protein FimE